MALTTCVSKFVFEDGTTWLLRLPRTSSICSQHAGEKVIMGVEALDIILNRTTVPVQEVKDWGCAEQNPLGIGPFLIMEFIQGTRLSSILTKPGSRVLKEDISDGDIEFLYRQMANFMLQIFDIDFNALAVSRLHVLKALSIYRKRRGGSVQLAPEGIWYLHRCEPGRMKRKYATDQDQSNRRRHAMPRVQYRRGVSIMQQ